MAHGAIKPGKKLFSAASECEIVVIRTPGDDLAVDCAGAPMLDERVDGGSSDRGAEEILIGKRYTDSAGRLEVLCTRGGGGPLVVNGEPLQLLEAKPLPASD